MTCPVCGIEFEWQEFTLYRMRPPSVAAIHYINCRYAWAKEATTRMYFCSQKCKREWKKSKSVNYTGVKDLVDQLERRILDW